MSGSVAVRCRPGEPDHEVRRSPGNRGVFLRTLASRSFDVLDCAIASDRSVLDGQLKSGLAAELAGSRPAACDPVPAACRDLLELLAGVTDGRPGQGRDHPVAAVLALAAPAVVAGSRSFTAIAGRAADVPAVVLEDLYRRCGVTRPGAGPPSKATIWRVVTGADTTALDTATGAWLMERASAAGDLADDHLHNSSHRPLASAARPGQSRHHAASHNELSLEY
jgi:hypothetical protein